MPVTVNLTLKKDKTKADGTIPIYIRITENRKSRYISTGISVKENDWNKRQQEIRKSHPLYPRLNQELSNLKLKAETKKSKLREDDKLDAKTLKHTLQARKNITIQEFGDQYRQLLKSQDRFWEFKHFAVILNDMERFKASDTVISQIDLNFLERFKDFLLHTRENNRNTVRKKMQRFKGMVNEVIKRGHLKEDPFKFFDTIKREKVNKAKLSIEQVQAIEELDLKQDSNLWHTRNYFMFSFYSAGIRFSDLCTLKPSDIIDGRLRYTMKKTGNAKNIKLYPQALEILAHYNTDDNTQYIFPLLDKIYTDEFVLRRKISSRNVLTNKWLKKIARKAHIQENLTFHIARHSFANVALKKGMSVYSLSKALAHSDLKITESYIKSFDEELLDEEMDNVFN